MAHEPRTVWILVRPASDVEGQWTAHCLDFDVVTQGNSVEHACVMAREAVDMVVTEDVTSGQDPFDRDQAPDDDWAPLWKLMRHAIPLRHVPKEKWSKLKLVAMAYEVCVPEVRDNSFDLTDVPPSWLASGLRDSNRDSGSFHTL